MIESKKNITVTISGNEDIKALSDICEIARIYIQEQGNKPASFDVRHLNYKLSELFEATR